MKVMEAGRAKRIGLSLKPNLTNDSNDKQQFGFHSSFLLRIGRGLLIASCTWDSRIQGPGRNVLAQGSRNRRTIKLLIKRHCECDYRSVTRLALGPYLAAVR